MEIYIDIIFAINLVMDYFILWIVSRLNKNRTCAKTLLLGSFSMSTLYCLVLFTPYKNQIISYIISFVILTIGIIITFRPKTLKTFFKLVLFIHISSFTVGGMGMAMFFYTSIGNYAGDFMVYTFENFSFKILITSICMSYIIIKLTSQSIKNMLIKKQAIYTINIHYDNKISILNALVDTGNTLKEPLTLSPVIITEFSAVEEFLPASLLAFFKNNLESNDFDVNSLFGSINDIDTINSIRLIPFKSVGEKNGLLLGFKPDNVEIIEENSVINVKDVIIGIYNCCLSKDGTYQGLLSPELIAKSTL